MKLSLERYKEKVEACWMGKNIGGTLGAPFECKRGVYDADFYTHDLSVGALPNDDLDLQLIWLNAAEKYGREVDSKALGEYWLSFICANWSEYGAARNNLAMGLLPPISGWYRNPNRDSCGAFIRSEIWACLTPGHPELAVKYAYEDAIVDHSNEGVYAEVFCAAVQSAAFAETDIWKLIEIGTSYIPKDCGVKKGIDTAVEAYKEGVSWQEGRKRILCAVPGSFGMIEGYVDHEPEADIPVGKMGYDAPSNIGLMILGLIYGEGDFGKSLCIAANCAEDADCTAATLGALLGIILGIEQIPQKWIDPIGRGFKNIAINKADNDVKIPDNVDELSDRITALMPEFLYPYYDLTEQTLELNSGAELANIKRRINAYVSEDFSVCLEKQPFVVNFKGLLFDVDLDYIDGVDIAEGGSKKIRLRIKNTMRRRQFLNIKWHVPQGFSVSGGGNTTLCLPQFHGEVGFAHAEYTLCYEELCEPAYDLIIEISSNGRNSKTMIPIKLINNTGEAE